MFKTGVKTFEAAAYLKKCGADVDYVVLAQPALYGVLSTTPGRSQYANLQELYKQNHQGLCCKVQ